MYEDTYKKKYIHTQVNVDSFYYIPFHIKLLLYCYYIAIPNKVDFGKLSLFINSPWVCVYVCVCTYDQNKKKKKHAVILQLA